MQHVALVDQNGKPVKVALSGQRTLTLTMLPDSNQDVNYLAFVPADFTTIEVTVVAGYNLISNPLSRGSNTLNEVIRLVPEGSEFYLWDPATLTWRGASVFLKGSGWVPNLSLPPGIGAFLRTPAGQRLQFQGTITAGTTGSLTELVRWRPSGRLALEGRDSSRG